MTNIGQAKAVRFVGQARRIRFGLILLLTLWGGAAVVWAQAQVVRVSAVAAPPPISDAGPDSVRLLVGRSAVLDVGSAVARVSLTSADIADALVTSSNQLLIHGKMPGTISMFIWDRTGAVKRYEVIVQRDLVRLSEQVKELFPGEKIDVQSNGKNIVLAGTVSSKDVIEKAVNVAAGYVDKREEVVALLQLQPNAPSNQVLLRVRFAEVSRSALTELGLSLAANGYKNGRWFGRTTTQQFAAPEWDKDGKFVFSDFLNLFLFDSKNELAGVMKALQTRGLFQSLAEPNLVAESGKDASFLAGGEFPIPVVQGSTGNFGISVVFKEFGIRLNFTPIVNGNRVHLKVRPEVSTLDFNNAITLQGFRIPALSSRRAETELELENGQTFAIAGLIDNSLRSSLQKIPGIGDIPVLGLLFKSKSAQKEQTELVVMITPEILPNNSRGVTPNLPRLPEPYLPPLPEKETTPPPPAAFGGPRVPGTISAEAAPVVPPHVTEPIRPASAASAVSALTPAAPRPIESVSQQLPVAPPPVGAKPLTDREKKALERARALTEQRARERAKADERAKAEDLKRQSAQAAEDQRKAEQERERQDKVTREQAKRDAKAAEEAKEREAKAVKIAKEAAQKELERERERQKVRDEAAARLKAAQTEYEADVAKANKH